MTTRRPQPALRPVCVAVDWGNELHECPMSMRTWKRILGGNPVLRVEPYWYEGRRYRSEWRFNTNGYGSLRVTYCALGGGGDEGDGYIGSIEDALIVVDGESVKWVS